MSVQFFVGEAPQNIKQWFIDNVPNVTIVWYSNDPDDYKAVLIEGQLTAANIQNISNITKIKIGSSVTSIGMRAFNSCPGLTSVTIPDSVTNIAWAAFDGCSKSLFDTASIPGVKLVDGWAVDKTDLLSGDLNLAGVRGVGGSVFSSCSKLTSVTIGNGVTSIGSSAFSSCSGLTSVTIGNGVTSIGRFAFVDCSGLTSVTIGNGVTNIGEQAFSSCKELISLTIGDNITSIDYSAFECCTNLTNVTFDGTTVPIGKNQCFYGTDSLNDIYMLNISVSDVQASLDDNISWWWLGYNLHGGYHTVTIHCKDGEVVIDPTPSGSSSS